MRIVSCLLIGLAIVTMAGCVRPCCEAPCAQSGSLFGQWLAERPGSSDPALVPIPAGWPPNARWTGPYHSLTVAECQCQAINSTTLANLLDDERGRRDRFRLCGQKCADLEDAILGYSAFELRNRQAGDALEAYYRLLEAESRADILDQSQAEVRDQVAQLEEMQARGIRPPVEVEALRRQLLQLRGDDARLQLAIAQLNHQLGQLLGEQGALAFGGLDYRLWPDHTIHVDFEAIDVEWAVDVGLASRSDLNLLRCVSSMLSIHSLDAARQLLSGISPLLAQSTCGCSSLAKVLMLLMPHRAVAVVRAQVNQLLSEREAAAASEIRLAVEQIEARARLVALAQQTVQSQERRRAELEEQKAKGIAAPGLPAARLDLLRARGELLTERAQWAIARVQLKRAQGLLPFEQLEDGPIDVNGCEDLD